MDSNRDPNPQRVWVFFYGTFMSARILREHGIDCESTTPAALAGYRLEINPRANLLPDLGHICYGGIAHIPKSDLDELYRSLHERFGLDYRPTTRMRTATKLTGGDQLVLVYVCEEMSPTPADPAYIDEMLRCCEELALPDSCAQIIESFRP